MNTTILSLTGYIVWTLLLLISLVSYRSILIIQKERDEARFLPSGEDLPQFGYQLTRALANCTESFPFIGGLMLLAVASNSMEITNSLAFVLLAARISQSVVHLISISTLFIQLRFALFLIQVGICAYWAGLFVLRFVG